MMHVWQFSSLDVSFADTTVHNGTVQEKEQRTATHTIHNNTTPTHNTKRVYHQPLKIYSHGSDQSRASIIATRMSLLSTWRCPWFFCWNQPFQFVMPHQVVIIDARNGRERDFMWHIGWSGVLFVLSRNIIGYLCRMRVYTSRSILLFSMIDRPSFFSCGLVVSNVMPRWEGLSSSTRVCRMLFLVLGRTNSVVRVFIEWWMMEKK